MNAIGTHSQMTRPHPLPFSSFLETPAQLVNYHDNRDDPFTGLGSHSLTSSHPHHSYNNFAPHIVQPYPQSASIVDDTPHVARQQAPPYPSSWFNRLLHRRQ